MRIKESSQHFGDIAPLSRCVRMCITVWCRQEGKKKKTLTPWLHGLCGSGEQQWLIVFIFFVDFNMLSCKCNNDINTFTPTLLLRACIYVLHIFYDALRFTKRSFLFFLCREPLDPYFLGMFRPTGRCMTGAQRECGDSLDVSGNFRSTRRRFTWRVRRWEGGTSRTATRLSASTFPVGTEGLASGTRSPFTEKKNH